MCLRAVLLRTSDGTDLASALFVSSAAVNLVIELSLRSTLFGSIIIVAERIRLLPLVVRKLVSRHTSYVRPPKTSWSSRYAFIPRRLGLQVRSPTLLGDIFVTAESRVCACERLLKCDRPSSQYITARSTVRLKIAFAVSAGILLKHGARQM